MLPFDQRFEYDPCVNIQASGGHIGEFGQQLLLGIACNTQKNILKNEMIVQILTALDHRSVDQIPAARR